MKQETGQERNGADVLFALALGGLGIWARKRCERRAEMRQMRPCWSYKVRAMENEKVSLTWLVSQESYERGIQLSEKEQDILNRLLSRLRPYQENASELEDMVMNGPCRLRAEEFICYLYGSQEAVDDVVRAMGWIGKFSEPRVDRAHVRWETQCFAGPFEPFGEVPKPGRTLHGGLE